jgi:hypothetical protein
MQTMLVEYLLEQARWRDEKGADWPDDSRNAKSAEALVAAAREVDDLPADDPRLAQLDALQRPYGLDVFSPGEDARRLISRYGFDPAPASAGALLEAIIDAEVRSSTENVDDEMRWHGMSDEGAV